MLWPCSLSPSCHWEQAQDSLELQLVLVTSWLPAWSLGHAMSRGFSSTIPLNLWESETSYVFENRREGKLVSFRSRSHHGCLWPWYSISLDTLGLKAASLCICAVLHMAFLYPVLSGIRDPLSPLKAHHTACGGRLLLPIKTLWKVESMSTPFFP